MNLIENGHPKYAEEKDDDDEEDNDIMEEDGKSSAHNTTSELLLVRRMFASRELQLTAYGKYLPATLQQLLDTLQDYRGGDT